MILPIDVVQWMVVAVAMALLLIMVLVMAQFVRALLTGELNALDLMKDPDGRWSEAKLWTHVGKGMAVYVMIKDAADGQPTLELQAMLLTILVAHEFFKKLLTMKLGMGGNGAAGQPVPAKP